MFKGASGFPLGSFKAGLQLLSWYDVMVPAKRSFKESSEDIGPYKGHFESILGLSAVRGSSYGLMFPRSPPNGA